MKNTIDKPTRKDLMLVLVEIQFDANKALRSENPEVIKLSLKAIEAQARHALAFE